MTRTYSFDHYTAKPPEPPRLERAEDRGRLSHPQEGPTEAKAVHYGRQHAQTEKLYREHQRPARSRSSKRKAAVTPVEAVAEGAPIGALPRTDEVHPPDEEDLRGVVDEFGRQVRAARSAGSEFMAAGFRLVKLPWVAGRRMLRRLLPKR